MTKKPEMLLRDLFLFLKYQLHFLNLKLCKECFSFQAKVVKDNLILRCMERLFIGRLRKPFLP